VPSVVDAIVPSVVDATVRALDANLVAECCWCLGSRGPCFKDPTLDDPTPDTPYTGHLIRTIYHNCLTMVYFSKNRKTTITRNEWHIKKWVIKQEVGRIMITDKSPFFESLNQCYVIHRVRGCVIHRVRGCVIHRVRGCVRGLCQSLFSNHLNRGCVQGLYKNQCVCTSTCRSLLSKPLVEASCRRFMPSCFSYWILFSFA
jgi:hypothetical protein